MAKSKVKWLMFIDETMDLVMINADHVDYIRTDLGQLRVKFASDDHESRFDVKLTEDNYKELAERLGE